MKPDIFSVWVRIGLTVAALAGLFGGAARADDTTGISVVGSGVIRAMPDTVEIKAEVKAQAELADEALQKHRTARANGVKAIEGLRIAGLTVTGGGLRVKDGEPDAQTIMMARRSQANPNAKASLQISETLTITMGKIDKLPQQVQAARVVEIIDAAKDGGLQVGAGPLVNPYYQVRPNQTTSIATFKLTNLKPLRRKAYEQAMADAREKAANLAALAGVKLGKVRSVKDVTLPKSSDPQTQQVQMYLARLGMPVTGLAGDDTISSPSLVELPVSVQLAVQFEIDNHAH